MVNWALFHVAVIFFSTQILGELKFFGGDRHFSMYSCSIFSLILVDKDSYSDLLLFGYVTLLSGTFLLI